MTVSNSYNKLITISEVLRAVSAVGLLAVGLAGIIYGWVEYNDSKKESHVLESMTLFQQFTGNSNNSIDSYLSKQIRLSNTIFNEVPSIRCDFIKEIDLKINGETLDKESSCNEEHLKVLQHYLKSDEKSISNKKVTRFSNYYSQQIAQRTKDFESEYFDLLGHYLTAVRCVEVEACDGDTAFTVYHEFMANFINLSCHYFKYKAKRWNESEAIDRELVKFLTTYSNDNIIPADGSCAVKKKDSTE